VIFEVRSFAVALGEDEIANNDLLTTFVATSKRLTQQSQYPPCPCMLVMEWIQDGSESLREYCAEHLKLQVRKCKNAESAEAIPVSR
jgi:hypothetical protein